MCRNSKPASLEWAITFWSSLHDRWGLSFWRELRGTFGVVSWHGSRGSYVVVVGTERGDATYSNTAVSPSSECLLASSDHITLCHPCQWWQWGSGPSALCFLSGAFSSRILTISRSSLSFPSLLLCRSHSFGGATLKGRYGQPCLTRKRPGSRLVSMILSQTGRIPLGGG